MKRLLTFTLASLALSAAAYANRTTVEKETSRDRNGNLHRSTTIQQRMEDNRTARPTSTENTGPRKTKTTTTTRRGSYSDDVTDDVGSTIEE